MIQTSPDLNRFAIGRQSKRYEEAVRQADELIAEFWRSRIRRDDTDTNTEQSE